MKSGASERASHHRPRWPQRPGRAIRAAKLTAEVQEWSPTSRLPARPWQAPPHEEPLRLLFLLLGLRLPSFFSGAFLVLGLLFFGLGDLFFRLGERFLLLALRDREAFFRTGLGESLGRRMLGDRRFGDRRLLLGERFLGLGERRRGAPRRLRLRSRRPPPPPPPPPPPLPPWWVDPSFINSDKAAANSSISLPASPPPFMSGWLNLQVGPNLQLPVFM
mmetsp:Transcript_103611/g.263151  ORF Transcript_103611/g.263151 Transcript_103611/m.263151 type:complete len:219 (-) Transcript_103611:942-1598(-)